MEVIHFHHNVSSLTRYWRT